VFEVDDVDEGRAIAQAIGLLPTCTTFVARMVGDAHLAALTDAIVASSSSSIFLAGRAAMIQQLRTALKVHGRSVVKNKAYWAAGKRGLD
jgi:NADPH-dependent ferric siderophore reductase